MAGFTDSFEVIVLDGALGDANHAPGAFSVGLSTTTPTEAGANFTEPVGNNYSRLATVDGDWAGAVSGQPASKANGVLLAMPLPSGSWGTATYFGLFEAATLRIFGPLAVPQAIAAGNPVEFAIGALRVLLGDQGDTFA